MESLYRNASLRWTLDNCFLLFGGGNLTRISAAVENKDSREFMVRSSLKISWWKQKIVYQKSAPPSKRHIEIRLQHSDRIPLTFFKSYSTPLGYSFSQGCNGRFLVGKTATVAATSPAGHHCCALFYFLNSRHDGGLTGLTSRGGTATHVISESVE